MSTYKVILKEKVVYVSVEADSDNLDANYLTLKKGDKVADIVGGRLQ